VARFFSIPSEEDSRVYATFKKETGQTRTKFRAGEQISLFGCNEGWIPWLVQEMMPPRQNEPYVWHLNVHDCLALPAVRNQYPNATAIIVDIKPTAKTEFFVCELLDVYGYSSDEWTPLLWRMRVLEIGGDPKANHLEDFDASNDGDIIYEFLYAMGSISEGRIDGTWNPPKPSPTNGVLLWPKPLAYFMGCIKPHPARC
jgi:hypothetical protein